MNESPEIGLDWNFIQMVATPSRRESSAMNNRQYIIIIIQEYPDSLLHWAVLSSENTDKKKICGIPNVCTVIYRRCGTISTDNRSYLIAAAKRSLLLSMMDRSGWTVSWEMMERDGNFVDALDRCPSGCVLPIAFAAVVWKEEEESKIIYFEEIKRMPPSLIFSIVSFLDSLRNCQRHDRAAQFQLPVSSLSPYNKSFKEKIFPNLCVLYMLWTMCRTLNAYSNWLNAYSKMRCSEMGSLSSAMNMQFLDDIQLY